MNQITLPNTNRQTSQLGFGCSSLMGATGRKESLALLEHAYDAGIRHFDVAPMYGYGAAEGCLGEFLAHHRSDVTVTTKYGIPPPRNQGLMRAARRAVGPVLKLIPSVKRKLASAANSVTASEPKAPFTATAAQLSLDHSLAELRTDHIDFWLLHEAEAADLNDDSLHQLLEDAVRAGKIGAYGCGSNAGAIPALLAQKPQYCPVLQFEWSVLDKPVDAHSAFTLHHRSLTANFQTLQSTLSKRPAVRNKWSSETGVDLAEPGKLAALMLKAALVLNPASVVLVSSRNRHHIEDNVRVAGDDTLAAAARKLYNLAQNEGATLLTSSS